MLDIAVIDDPKAAAAALTPLRTQLLSELTEPASAAQLAERLGEPRQRLRYHLRTLEAHGLIKVEEKRAWGGITESLFIATAKGYVVSPDAFGPAACAPEHASDRLSAGYLISLAARAVQEVGAMLSRARVKEKRLATLSIDTTVRFRSARERAEFSRELTASVTQLVARYHDDDAPGGRSFRLVLLAHPHLPGQHPKEQA